MTTMDTTVYDPTNKHADAFNSANHVYLASHTGAYAHPVADRLNQEVWVTDYWDPSYGSDWRIPIQRAIQAGGLVRFPPGEFYVSRDSNAIGVQLVSNTFLVGAGQGVTVIKALDGTGNIHLVSTIGTGNTNIGIFNLTLDHNGTAIGATTGCHAVRINEVDGFYMRGVAVKNSDQHGIVTEVDSSSHTVLDRVNKNIFISDVYLENIGVSGRGGGDGLRLFYGAKDVVVNNVIGYGIEYHGIHVAYGAATVNNVILYNVGNVAISPQSDGVVMSNIHVEWESDHLICDLLANRPTAGTFGRHFYASDTGDWFYDNGVQWMSAQSDPSGLWAITRSGTPLFPAGGKSHYSNVKIVMNITENTSFNNWASSDGFRLDTDYNSADNIYVSGKFRFGAYITGDNNNVSKITIDGCREDGIRISGGANNILDNWRVVTANLANNSSRAVRLSSCLNNKIINGYSLDSRTTIAISEEGTTNLSIITGNDVRPASSTKISPIGVDSVVRGNLGYKTEAKGTATIPSGSTSVSVTHGLNRTPSNGSIIVTPTNNPTTNPGYFWVSGTTSTVFVINCQNNPGSSGASFSWNAEVL